MPQAYCMRCKAKREIINPHTATTRNRRKAVRGTCPVCTTTVSRFVK